MSLTTDFLANLPNFMADQAILIPAQIPAKNGNFQFAAQGAHAALMQVATGTPNIPGYYVKPVANNNNEFALPTQQPGTYYMLTDQMNGCQFIAYGPDRQHVTVEHNNFINDPGQYALRLAAIQATHPAYLFHMTAGAANNINAGVYNSMQGVNIVGYYTAGAGWNFRVRDRVDQNNGHVYGPY